MATVQIPQLPLAIGLDGTEQIEGVQDGVSVRMTSAQIAALAAGGGSVLEQPNTVYAGPVTGIPALPTFRALVGADLPKPSASSLGGIQSASAVAHQWVASISASGVPSLAQPAFSDVSGSVAAAQMPALTGDVTTTAGAVVTTIAAGAVTNTKLANMAATTLKGNATGASAAPQDLTAAQTTALLSAMVGDSGSGGTKGLAPAPAAGDAAAGKFLGAGGIWAVPAGSGVGTVTSVGLSAPSEFTVSNSPVTASGTLTLAWNSAVTVAHGGTGFASYTIGDILYASGATALSKLSDVATGNALLSGGVGVAPSWGKIGLTTHITGTLALANGGLGITSGTSGGVLYFSSTSTVASSGALTANAIVLGGGAGASPAPLGSLGTTTTVLHGNASGAPTFGPVALATDVSGTLSVANGGTGITNNPNVLAITVIANGNGSALAPGIIGDIMVPFACTITSWTLLADQSGSIVVNVWSDLYVNYPPTSADKITASLPPTISASTKGQSSTLTGWTAAIPAGNTLRFNIDSTSAVTRITLILTVTRT